MVDVLSHDHIETLTLRKYARYARCLVVGAYKGATMNYLLDHDAKLVVGYEPQKWAWDRAFDNLMARGDDVDRWRLCNFALVPWEVSNDFPGVTTLVKTGTDAATIGVGTFHPGFGERVPTLNVMEAVEDMDADGGIDFAVINCEGGEYLLLPWLAPHCKVMLVQFHGPAPLPCYPNHMNRERIGKGWFLYTEHTPTPTKEV